MNEQTKKGKGAEYEGGESEEEGKEDPKEIPSQISPGLQIGAYLDLNDISRNHPGKSKKGKTKRAKLEGAPAIRHKDE
jgi:hypothetical protein